MKLQPRIALCFLLTATALAGADSADLVQALSSDDPTVRANAYEHAADYGPEAIPAVASLLDGENQPAAKAAKRAIENITGTASRSSRSRTVATRALCQAVQSAHNPEARDWLLWVVSYTATPEAIPVLAPLLDDPRTFDMALFAIENIGGESAAQTLIGRLPADADQRVAIVNALGGIGDASATDSLLAIAKREDPARMAAIRALGRIGSIEAEPVVWQAIEDSGDWRAVQAYLDLASHQKRRTAKRMYRSLLGATNVPNTQCAALHGLASVADPALIDIMLPFVRSEHLDVRAAAMQAFLTLDGTAADRRIRRAFLRPDSPARAELLEILAARAPRKTRPLLERAVDDDCAEVRASALRLLGLTEDPAYETLFVDRTHTGSQDERVAAVSGYIRLVVERLASDPAAGQTMYRALLADAADPGRPSYPFEEPPPRLLRNELASCSLAVANTAAESDPNLAESAYRDAIRCAADPRLAEQAGQGLAALGITVDLPKEQGFVTRWQFIGPFPRPSFDAEYPPAHEYQPNGEYDGATGKVHWMDHRVEHSHGIVPLHDLLGLREPGIAYARAVVSVPDAADVFLKIGSNDGVVCWINGGQVHRNEVDRSLEIDADVLPATLTSGENVILLKIVNSGGRWEFCLRIAGGHGMPLTFEN